MTRLIDSAPEARARVLDAAVAKASYRPALRDPAAVPSYVERG
ncbi:hypothetical protein SBBP2_1500006 [Burkholderiales bacterium]|nr:hypothetical protein SBBP2_1500006 [Burkholderiales bacterium]